MIFHRAHSNKSLVIALTSAVVIDGVLTAVVLHRHHDHSTANEQLSLRTAPSVSIPAGANIVVPRTQWLTPIQLPHPILSIHRRVRPPPYSLLRTHRQPPLLRRPS